MTRCCDGYGCPRCAYPAQADMPEKIWITADGSYLGPIKPEIPAQTYEYLTADLVAAKDAEIARLRECVRDLVEWDISPEYWDAVEKHADTIKAAQEAGE